MDAAELWQDGSPTDTIASLDDDCLAYLIVLCLVCRYGQEAILAVGSGAEVLGMAPCAGAQRLNLHDELAGAHCCHDPRTSL